MDIPMNQSKKKSHYVDQEPEIHIDIKTRTSSLTDKSISMSLGSISRSLSSFNKLKYFSSSSTESSARHLHQFPIYK